MNGQTEKQTTENRQPKTENRQPKTENRKQTTKKLQIPLVFFKNSTYFAVQNL